MRQRTAFLLPFWTSLVLCLALLTFTAPVAAQTNGVPKNLVVASDGKYSPAPGYEWTTNDPKDLRVRWTPGLRHTEHSNVLAGDQEGKFRPATGYKWLNDTPGDFRVVKAGPTQEQVGRAVLKALGALALHQASKPQPGDGFAEELVKGIARKGRDELIDSALQDLFSNLKAAERDAIRGLAVLALDGRLERNRDRVITRLRQTNPNMAEAVEVAEFLIQLAQAIDQGRR